MKLFFQGGSFANWKWKSGDLTERRRQSTCFIGFLGTFGVSNHHKEAVAGWMLSEMLIEVPEHVPNNKS
jgi:hypothetical protein